VHAGATAFLCQERIEVCSFTLTARPELHPSAQEHNCIQNQLIKGASSGIQLHNNNDDNLSSSSS